jgi:hypothetical protein
VPAAQSDSWIEWAAHNLALGIGESKVRDELAANGFSDAESEAMVDELMASPIFRAARRLGGEVRKWASLSDALIELEMQAVDFTKIPRLSNLSSQDFLHDFYAVNRPVILEDVAACWPALAKWDLDYFRARFGEEEVAYQRGRSASDHRDSFVDHTVVSPLREYLDLIEAGGATNDYYLIAHDRLLDRPAFQPLLDDIVFDPRYLLPVTKEGQAFLWLGPPGTATPLHRDLGNVYFCQVVGRKAVTLIPSKQMHKVYNETGYHSEADLDRRTTGDYPLLDQALIMREVIHPGEFLFIPLGWWHHVSALDLSITVTGNNFKFPNTLAEIF